MVKSGNSMTKKKRSIFGKICNLYVRRRPASILYACEPIGVTALILNYLDKFEIEIDVNGGAITKDILRFGCYQYELMFSLSRLMSRRDLLFVNVGANIGTTCLNAFNVGFRRFVAIEPVAANFAKLRRNFERNGIDANLFNCGISDFTGAGSINLHPGSSGQHSVKISFEGGFSQTVQFDTLDRLLCENRADDKFLWIDVEGAELDVINGAKDTMASDRCIGLCVEIAPKISGVSAAIEVINNLDKLFSSFFLSGPKKISANVVREEIRSGRAMHLDLFAFK